MLLIDLLDKYPLELKLRDGTPVLVRPLARRDDVRLQKFFQIVPEEERLFIKQPITDRTLFRQWCRQADFERNLPLTHPEYRGRDVSKVLVTELIEIARHCGLRRLEAEVNGERKIALQVLARLGFNELMHLEDYVLDMKAITHDYVLLGKNLKVDEEYAGLGG
jgi:GNAT superfamily N-acetyltransferase